MQSTNPNQLAVNGAAMAALRLLSTGETAEALGLKPQTLRVWRIRGGGPRFIRLSASRVAYDSRDLDEWVRSRAFASTSEETLSAQK